MRQQEKFMLIMEHHRITPFKSFTAKDGAFVWKPSEETAIFFYNGKCFSILKNGEFLNAGFVLKTIVSFALKHATIKP